MAWQTLPVLLGAPGSRSPFTTHVPAPEHVVKVPPGRLCTDSGTNFFHTQLTAHVHACGFHRNLLHPASFTLKNNLWEFNLPPRLL